MLATLTTEPKITAEKVTEKNADGAIESSKSVTLQAQTVQSEEQLVGAQGASYVRVRHRSLALHRRPNRPAGGVLAEPPG